jgi:hypothetical protein
MVEGQKSWLGRKLRSDIGVRLDIRGGQAGPVSLYPRSAFLIGESLLDKSFEDFQDRNVGLIYVSWERSW